MQKKNFQVGKRFDFPETPKLGLAVVRARVPKKVPRERRKNIGPKTSDL
jgi:hypothetical protein